MSNKYTLHDTIPDSVTRFMGIPVTRTWRLVVCAGLILAPAASYAQELRLEETQRIARYGPYWELVDVPERTPPAAQDRMTAAIGEAQRDFAGRGPALAQHFLRHIQASPGNTAYFFLFRAVGDVDTALVLIQALIDTPVPQGSALGRDPGEIGIGVEAALGNESVRASPRVAAALNDTVRQARARLGFARVAQTAISLLGKSRTSEAAGWLQILAGDADGPIRAAALDALGTAARPVAGQTLSRALAVDPDPRVRAQAAEALARSQSAKAPAALQAALAKETDPQVVDATVRALTTLRALPEDPQVCLQAVGRCWDASVAAPLFDCWRASATRDQLVTAAASGAWTVRALALHSLAGTPRPQIQALVSGPPLPLPLDGNAQIRPLLNAPPSVPSPIPAAPQFDQATRDRLLQSAVEILSNDISGLPVPGTLSYETSRLVRDAFWEIAGRNMPLALQYADRILPIRGHYTSTGRFGESFDLSMKDRRAYAAWRRPRQLLAAAFAALLAIALLAVRRLRKLAVALLASVSVWALWSVFQTDIRELPPPPLGYLTVSCLAFLSAGFAAGLLTSLRLKGWLKVLGAPLLAGICAFVVCGFTRSASLFPIGSEGWELIFDPLSCALWSAPLALILALSLVSWRRSSLAGRSY